MISSTDNGPLSDADWVRLNEQSESLEKAWRLAEGESVDLGPFLPPAESPLRRRFLHELIKTELEIRWRRNRPVTLEDYLARFPELAPRDSLPPSLIYEEYRVRNLYGDRPMLADYRGRFPEQFDALEQRLQKEPLTLHYPTLKPPSRADGPSLPLAPPLPATLPPPAPRPLAHDFHSGDQILPNEGYTLGPKIGSGQFGCVYRARAPGGVEVAVKLIYRPLSDESCQREKRALEMICQLNHPYLLQTQSFWQMRDRLVIVMELADDSLADWLKACRAAGQPGIPPGELIAYFEQAAEALDCLHAQQLMHRDVKPANLLRLKGYAKVADFGLMRLQEQRLEQATIFGGTPGYMPPETWHGQVSIHSDQYSLAVAYAEMRLGRLIFRGSSQLDIALQHQKGTPDLTGLEPAEQRVLLQALAKNPDDRYPSCREFVRALAEAMAPRDEQPPPPPTSLWRTLGVAMVGAAATALLVLLGFLLYIKFHSPQQSPSRSPWVPPGFEKDEAAEMKGILGGQFYSRIRYGLKGAEEPLVFILIEPGDELRAFYIMRDKVSRQQFAAMLLRPAMQERLLKYKVTHQEEKKVWRTVRQEWERKWLTNGIPKDPEWPATHITPTEAHCFAECLGNGCRLPSTKEWDKAGGRYDGHKAPFDVARWRQRGMKGDIAINLPLNMFRPVGQSTDDVSLYSGCRDMAGNGYEWTRDVLGDGDKKVPLANPSPRDAVKRRGERPNREEPFRFENRPEPTADYDDPAEDTGFRVVLPIPDNK